LNNDNRSSIPSDEILVQAFAKLDRIALGVAVGTVCGLAVFVATILLIVKGGDPIGPNLSLLGQFFIGYTVTIRGAFIGLVYGFLVGFVIGFLIALVRNAAIGIYAYTVKAKQEFSTLHDFIDQ